MTTFLVWVMLIVGGSGNNRGAILGALVIWGIWSATELVTNRLPPDWITRASYIRIFLIGLLLQFVMQRFARGILPEKPPEAVGMHEGQTAIDGGHRRRGRRSGGRPLQPHDHPSRRRAADLDAIAALHAESWRTAYRGVLPDAFLDGPVEDDRKGHWYELMEGLGDERSVLVADAADGLAGFVSVATVQRGRLRRLYRAHPCPARPERHRDRAPDSWPKRSTG